MTKIDRLIEFIKLGYTNKEIATELHITEGTVKQYISRLYAKFDVKNRVEFINYRNNLHVEELTLP